MGYLFDTGQNDEPNQAFNVIYYVPSKKSKVICWKGMATAEAIYIRLGKPDLCVQKSNAYTLALDLNMFGVNDS